MKHKRQTLSKTDDEDSSKDDFKDDDTQSCSKLLLSCHYAFTFSPLFVINISDSNSKKSCQGCELPSDEVPDSTSNSRGQNNNTPSATNNNQSNPSERTNGAISRATPNSSIELAAVPNGPGVISNADSSVASTVSLEEEEESPVKIKKKEENHSRKVSWLIYSQVLLFKCGFLESSGQKGDRQGRESLHRQRFVSQRERPVSAHYRTQIKHRLWSKY